MAHFQRVLFDCIAIVAAGQSAFFRGCHILIFQIKQQPIQKTEDSIQIGGLPGFSHKGSNPLNHVFDVEWIV